MNEIILSLSTHTDKFVNQDLRISKKVNFIYGKNGTGKTTLADEFKNQHGESYEVRVFKDFDGVADNNRLDAIALGTINAEIQGEIDKADVIILNIRKDTDEPKDNYENYFTRNVKATDDHKKQLEKIDEFFTKTAQYIKNLTNPQIAKTTYNKSSLRGEISAASLLTDTELKRNIATIKAEPKEQIPEIVFPSVTLSNYLASTNDILGTYVNPQQPIPELQDNSDKQNFAKEGMRIHECGGVCVFCGNEISKKRWELLGNYFNDAVMQLDNRIDRFIKKIIEEIEKINNVKGINKDNVYEEFSEQVKLINLQIKATKDECKSYLNELKESLELKKKVLFTKSNEMVIVVPNDFSDIEAECKILIERNNTLSINLKKEQEKSKEAIRSHEVRKALTDFEYETENGKLSILNTTMNDAKQALINKKSELNQEISKRMDLIAQTKDEEMVANRINNLLKSNGVASFTLELIQDNDENQKGQYRVRGHDGNIRSIVELSKGEKNIIAFLYFMLALDEESESKPRIIILDDPMTSNDDTMQYLMTEEIKKFFKDIDQTKNCLILLTHNCHFFLNVRNNKAGQYNSHNKHGNFHLRSDGKLATIQPITNINDDLKTSYDELWNDLIDMYNQGKPNLMLVSCRRICETYIKFNHISDLFGSNAIAKKLFDVNMHSIDDLQAEMNGRSVDDIKNILKQVFIQNENEDHFNAHWSTS